MRRDRKSTNSRNENANGSWLSKNESWSFWNKILRDESWVSRNHGKAICESRSELSLPSWGEAKRLFKTWRCWSTKKWSGLEDKVRWLFGTTQESKWISGRGSHINPEEGIRGRTRISEAWNPWEIGEEYVLYWFHGELV